MNARTPRVGPEVETADARPEVLLDLPKPVGSAMNHGAAGNMMRAVLKG
jgi:hypothetical protein